MKVIKLIITLFLVVLCVLCVLGFAWWGSPPEKLQASAAGGRMILGLTLVGCIGGLVRLWIGNEQMYTPKG